MDAVINKLIDEHGLTDYEALAVTGIVGMLATSNDFSISKIYEQFENKLKPIVLELIN